MRDANNQGPIRLVIGEQEAMLPLSSLLEQLIGTQAAADALRHGGVWLGHKRIYTESCALPIGETLTISRPPTGKYSTLTLDPAWILFEDDDLIALDKPAGSYVEATPWDSGGHLSAALAAFLSARDQQSPQLHLAHRLDRDTSGVLLFTKNPAVNPALQRAFASGGVRKQYLCRCYGTSPADFELYTGHGRGAKGFFRTYPAEAIGQALPAGGGTIKAMHTRFRTRLHHGDTSIIEAQPTTGRTHQIRLHAAAAGFPVLGDTKYGGPAAWRGQTLRYHLLHAARLSLAHPRTGEPLVIDAADVWWANATSGNV